MYYHVRWVAYALIEENGIWLSDRVDIMIYFGICLGFLDHHSLPKADHECSNLVLSYYLAAIHGLARCGGACLKSGTWELRWKGHWLWIQPTLHGERGKEKVVLWLLLTLRIGQKSLFQRKKMLHKGTKMNLNRPAFLGFSVSLVVIVLMQRSSKYQPKRSLRL